MQSMCRRLDALVHVASMNTEPLKERKNHVEIGAGRKANAAWASSVKVWLCHAMSCRVVSHRDALHSMQRRMSQICRVMFVQSAFVRVRSKCVDQKNCQWEKERG